MIIIVTEYILLIQMSLALSAAILCICEELLNKKLYNVILSIHGDSDKKAINSGANNTGKSKIALSGPGEKLLLERVSLAVNEPRAD